MIMSKYTTEVRYICEVAAENVVSQGYSKLSDILKTAAPKVFNFDFPIFDEEYRLPLEIKILRHYYTREIGEETLGLWKLRLETRMNEIMPYYNQLYKSQLLDFNPFWNVNLTTKHNKENTGDKTGNETIDRDDTDSKTETFTSDVNVTDTTKEGTVRSGTTHDTKNGKLQTTQTENIIADKTKEEHTGGNSQTHTHTDDSHNITDSRTGKNTIKGDSTTTPNTTDYKLYSDTPQGALTGVNNEKYLTNATKETSSGNTKVVNNSTENTEGSSTSKDTQLLDSDVNVTYTEDVTSNATESSENNLSVDTTTGDEGNGEYSDDWKTDTTYNSDTGTESTKTSSDKFASDITTNTKENFTNTEDYLQHVYGKSAGKSYSELLMEYRKTFLNIDNMIIDELSDLFINLW